MASMRASQRGVALLIVLWACTLLAILLGGYAAVARVEALQARHQYLQTQARYAAQAGVMRAIYEMQAQRENADSVDGPQQGPLWVADGRPYTFQLDGAKIRVTVTDESGKVDLNTADPKIVEGLFVAVGVDAARAHSLAADIVEWREAVSPQDMDAQQRYAQTRQRYASAGLSYGPRNGSFASLEELQAVVGMTPAIYDAIVPAITLWSGQVSPAPAHASALVLASLPGMDRAAADRYIALRDGASADAPPPLPNGMPGGSGAQGNAKTIFAEAWTGDGVRAALRITVRFQLLRADLAKRFPSFTILRWREDVGS